MEKTIILGQVSDINKHRVDDILNKYHPSYIVRKTDLNLKMVENYSKPLVGNLLIYIEYNEEVYLPTLNKILDKFREINISYVDILVICSKYKANIRDLGIIEVNIIELSKTYREDFQLYIKNKFDIEPKYVKLVAKQLNYSFKSITKNYQKIINKQYTEIKTDKLINLSDMIYEILNKTNKGLRLFEEICNKYSLGWCIDEIISILEQSIKYKLNLYKYKKIKIKDISDYKKIVTDIPIYNLYRLLLNLRLYKQMGILIYYKED